jgi:large subunit ribosomal protein L16
MLIPKKAKFRKWHTMRVNPRKKMVDTRGTTLAYGSYGLKAEEAARIRSNQIEAARKAMSKELKKTGKIWIRIFPDMPFTAKPAEVGMGKGKGDPQGYQFIAKAGRVLFEIDGVDEALAKKTLGRAADKMPLRTKFVSRQK